MTDEGVPEIDGATPASPEPERYPFWGYHDLLLFAGLAIPCMLLGYGLVRAVLRLFRIDPAMRVVELLPAQFAGRKFDAKLLADLPEGADPCGENGEFHTCVVAGPMFSRRLAVTSGERVERDGYAYCDLVMG